MIKRNLYFAPQSRAIAVYLPPPHLQVELAEAHRDIRQYEDMVRDIRSQLTDAAQGRCSPDAALLAIAQLIGEEVKP